MMLYRKDIDGLRGIAVLSVIIFHSGLNLFKGAFIGVDIFFVISGYLISSIIFNDLSEKKFNLIIFYIKRVLRIIPSLLSVILFCLPFALFLLTPYEIREFSQSIISSILFFSNFFFLHENSYFFEKTIELPLIHTWSLSIEEQFYFVYPLIFSIFFLKRNLLIYFLSFVWVLSLLSCIYFSNLDLSLNFYLTTSRIWELLSGALTYLFLDKFKIKKNQLICYVGILFIILSIFIFHEESKHPGILTLIPISGSVMILIFSESNQNKNILNTRFLVFTGKISYSLYLFHLPIISFLLIHFNRKLYSYEILFFIIISYAISYLNYRYIESFFRYKKNKNFNFKYRLIIILPIIFLLLIFSYYGHKTNGFKNILFNENQIKLLEYQRYNYYEHYRADSCFLDKTENNFNDYDDICYQNNNSLIWGDSYAAALSSGWYISKNRKVGLLSSTGCPPTINFNVIGRPNCKKNNEYIYEIIKKHKPKNLFLHAKWTRNNYGEDMLKSLNLTIIELKKLDIANIYLIGSVPIYEESVIKNLFRNKQYIQHETQFYNNNKKVKYYDQLLKEIAKKNEIIFIDVNSLICKENYCKIISKINGDYNLITWDDGHLTKEGSILISNKIKEIIKLR